MPDLAVSDTAALAIAAAINSQTTAMGTIAAANAALLEKLFGSTATTATPGGVTAQTAIMASGIGTLLAKIDASTAELQSLTLALGKVSSSLETVTTAAANVQYTMTQQLTTQQLAVADQIKNNKFQQATTNAALQDAGKEPTVIVPTEYQAQLKSAISDIGEIKLQTAATTLITQALSDSATKGFEISAQWVGSTKFGEWVGSYYQEAKIKGQLLYADQKAKAALEIQLEKVLAARISPQTATKG